METTQQVNREPGEAAASSLGLDSAPQSLEIVDDGGGNVRAQLSSAAADCPPTDRPWNLFVAFQLTNDATYHEQALIRYGRSCNAHEAERYCSAAMQVILLSRQLETQSAKATGEELKPYLQEKEDSGLDLSFENRNDPISRFFKLLGPASEERGVLTAEEMSTLKSWFSEANDLELPPGYSTKSLRLLLLLAVLVRKSFSAAPSGGLAALAMLERALS